MPELPEVEHVRRTLEAAVADRRLTSVELRRADLRWPVPARTVRSLQGRRLRSVERTGKYLLLEFDRAAAHALIVHLGMSGRVLVGQDAAPWQRHEHWRLGFGPRVVRYVDPRRFGALLAAPAAAIHDHPLLASIGPDPLAGDFDPETLFRRSRGRRTTLKSFLLDGSNIAGIGNIYACEACFLAGIRPQTRVHRISRRSWSHVHAAIRSVLQRALAAGGTTFRDYAGTAGEPGRFQVELMVYGREGDPCRVCGTRIKLTRLTGRSTFYCARCQRSRPHR